MSVINTPECVPQAELIAAAKVYWKARGFKKVRKRWTKTVGDFTLSFLIQGSVYEKENYYVRPGVFFNFLNNAKDHYYGHVWLDIRVETVEQVFRETEMLFEEWTNRKSIEARVNAYVELKRSLPEDASNAERGACSRKIFGSVVLSMNPLDIIKRRALFLTAAERKERGGSGYMELQYCRQPRTASMEEIVSVQRVKHWQGDSLYIYLDDIDEFISQYGGIFHNGVYSNLQEGEIDIYGINYFSPDRCRGIAAEIEKMKPAEYATVLEWLKRGEHFNGVYILGI